MEVLNPATGKVIAEVPRGTQADVDRAVAAAKQALPDWLETTPGERAELLLKLADALEANAEELAALESANVGKPLSYARDEIPVCVDNLRFFAGAARILEGRSSGEYMRGYTSMIRREPIGIVGGIAPWNYPLMMAVWKLGAGARRRQRPGAEAVRADAADGAPLRRARRRDPPARRLQRDHRRRRAGRRRDRPPSRRAPRLADRRRRDRQGDRPHRRRHAEARPPRARRQGAGDRLRRRRSGRSRGGDQDRRLLELGPGLHRRLARDRRPEDLRRPARAPRPRSPVAARRRSGRRRRHRDGPRDLEVAAGARLRLPASARRARR